MSENLKDIALKLQGIIDTAIDGIITIDDKGIVESINKSAAKQFLYSPDEVIGHNIKMLMPNPYHSEHDEYISRYNRTRKPKIIGVGREVIGLKKDKSTFPFRLAVSEVILNNRVIFTGIIHDLSEVKQAEDKLIKLNEQLEDKVEERTNELEKVVNNLLEVNNKLEYREKQLEEALTKEKELNELKSRFVSMASHEFRTPLSTILSSASLISKYNDKKLYDKSDGHVKKIKDSVAHLTGLLNDFLSLSKIEEGKLNIDFSEFNVNIVCKDVIEEVSGLIKGHQKITFSHDDKEFKINSDVKILKNILFNLLSNAIKYTNIDEGIIELKIETKSDSILFSVSDNGIGIPEAEQAHMFERFFRATNVENIQGTGLGLNIVKRYTEMLNGDISFKSQSNIGTTFFVSLPLK